MSAGTIAVIGMAAVAVVATAAAVEHAGRAINLTVENADLRVQLVNALMADVTTAPAPVPGSAPWVPRVPAQRKPGGQS